jgi:two-component system osmolarity sensor histidine kinase EnvZ
VRVSLELGARFAEVHVDDDGPGIAPDKREEALLPFRRLDEGRNLQTGGVGLGLSIARDIARAHGGELLLSQSPDGGLRATIRLPV